MRTAQAIRPPSRFARACVALILGLVGSTFGARAQAVQPGDSAPRCTLRALGAGPALDMSVITPERVVLVDFWASWCAPCAHAFGALNELENDLRDAGFSVIAVNVDENPGDAVDFLTRHPVDFAVGADPEGTCPRAYAVLGMPSSYLVDRRGIVRSVHRGFRPTAVPALRAEIEALLAEPAGPGAIQATP